MKILLINYEYPPLGAGAGNISKYIGENLVKFGCDVSVLTMKHKTLPQEEVINGVRIYRIPSLRRKIHQSNMLEIISYISSGVWQRRKILDRYYPDAIIAFMGIPGGAVAWWYWRQNKIPYIVSIMGGDVPGTQPEQLWLYHKLCKPIIKRIWLEAKFVVANSLGLRDLARQTMHEKEILCIPNGIDLDLFQPAEKKISADQVKLLYIGRISFEKRLDLLIEALADLKDLNWRLQVIGDGPQLKRIKHLADKNSLGAKVEFHGWLERRALIRFYQQGDIFVFPSTSEGMPSVVLEAMACGLPVITTRIPGCSELVEDGINGLLVEPRNKEQLMGAIKKLILAPEERRKFSQNSLLKASTHSWEKVGQAYLELLQQSIR